MIHSGTFSARRDLTDVYGLLANPERFAPFLPDLEGLTLQDATHFTARIAIAIGKINGHLDLAMELCEAVPVGLVRYQGAGSVAGSALTFAMKFELSPSMGVTRCCVARRSRSEWFAWVYGR